MWIVTFFTSRIGKYAAMVGGLLLAILAIFNAGSRAAKRKQKLKNMETYIDTSKRAQKVAEDSAREVGAMDDDELNRRLDKLGGLRGGDGS